MSKAPLQARVCFCEYLQYVDLLRLLYPSASAITNQLSHSPSFPPSVVVIAGRRCSVILSTSDLFVYVLPTFDIGIYTKILHILFAASGSFFLFDLQFLHPFSRIVLIYFPAGILRWCGSGRPAARDLGPRDIISPWRGNRGWSVRSRCDALAWHPALTIHHNIKTYSPLGTPGNVKRYIDSDTKCGARLVIVCYD